MLSYDAQEYVANMLDSYLEDENTVFKTSDIGLNPSVWKELEAAGIVKLFPHLGTAELDEEALMRYEEERQLEE